MAKHFEDIACNLLDPGSIYSFAGSELASNITEKTGTWISMIFLDMLEITQQNNYLECFKPS